MRTIEQQVKVGLDKQDYVNAEEAQELGYTIEETDNGKVYAVKTIETELPQSLDEAREFLDDDELLQLITVKKSSLSKLEYDRAYNKMRNVLSYNIPAKVKSLEEGYRSMVKMLGKDVAVLDEVSIKDKLDVESYEAAVKDLLGL